MGALIGGRRTEDGGHGTSDRKREVKSAYGMFVIACVVVSVTLTSCLFVKAPEQKQSTSEDMPLSPVPLIPMSDELIRSLQGDMIALLPEGWLMLDPSGTMSDHVIAVAVNPEYTLTAVFSSIPDAGSSRDAVESEGLLGLARIAYGQRTRRTAAGVKLVGTYSMQELGTRQFGLYSFSGMGGTLKSRSAVFVSTLGNYYEFSLVPVNVSGRDIPSDADQQVIFSSILATIQY